MILSLGRIGCSFALFVVFHCLIRDTRSFQSFVQEPGFCNQCTSKTLNNPSVRFVYCQRLDLPNARLLLNLYVQIVLSSSRDWKPRLCELGDSKILISESNFQRSRLVSQLDPSPVQIAMGCNKEEDISVLRPILESSKCIIPV